MSTKHLTKDGATWEASPAQAGGVRESAARRPSLSMLAQTKRLAVVNPDNGLVFAVSLAWWHGCLLGLYFHAAPGAKLPRGCCRSRLMGRAAIADYLAGLELPAGSPQPATGSPRISVPTTYKQVVRNWMLAFEQSALNLKQLRRLWRAWKHENFSA